MKARSLTGMARALVEDHDGRVPASMEALVKLPGRRPQDGQRGARSRLGVPGLPVDRHVLRVAGRIGLTRADDPEIVERDLCAVLPSERWTRASDC
jgi:endonuclease-3